VAVHVPAVSEDSSPFAQPPSEDRLVGVARALEGNGFATQIVNTGKEAKRAVLDLIPPAAEVHTSASTTLEMIGLHGELESGRYDSVRPKYLKLDRETQMHEIRKVMSAPQFMLTSAAAVAENGSLVLASGTGSQLGSVAFGAEVVIFVIGAQKIVSDLGEAMRRVEEYCFPLEDQRSLRAYGYHSGINKVLILNKEMPGRIHVILVKEPLGF